MTSEGKFITDFRNIQDYFISLQKKSCLRFESLEPKHSKFRHHKWNSHLGTGNSNILQGGAVWEKAGVNFSSIKADSLPPTASIRNPQLAKSPYQVCGISIVTHPFNPYIPASHLNLRFFLVNSQPIQWWFGGGFDLTPYYPHEQDCLLWHRNAKTLCDNFEQGLYQELKENCDKYFYLPHRNEMRGIGGLFFDDLNRWELDHCFSFVAATGDCYLNSYLRLAHKYKEHFYGDKEREFQLYRRGRYAEFNLLCDRGTLFGLQVGGRTESILMSLPPLVSWSYGRNHAHVAATAALRPFLQPRDWIDKT